jgi:hypothetical protein
MSTEYKVVAVIGGEEHRKKAAAYMACEDAGVTIPEELVKYFRGCTPCPEGKEVDLKIDWDISPGGGYSEKIVDLSKLPEGTYLIKFKTC